MNLSRAVSAPSLRPVIAKNGDTDVQVRLHIGAPTPIAIQRAFFMPAVFVMAAVRGRPFGVCRGPICPVLHTCAQLPPYSRASGRGRSPSHIGAVNHGQTYPNPPLFTVNPHENTETLLVNASETLSSLNALTCNLAFDLDTSQRATMLGIQQMAELGQLLVDRALEQVSPSPAS